MRYYKRVDQDGKTITVESYSNDPQVPGAVEIDKAEFDAYMASLPQPEPVPARDLAAELDGLEAALIKKGILTREEIDREISSA